MFVCICIRKVPAEWSVDILASLCVYLYSMDHIMKGTKQTQNWSLIY